jgi:hypothetical protein
MYGRVCCTGMMPELHHELFHTVRLFRQLGLHDIRLNGLVYLHIKTIVPYDFENAPKIV